MNISWTFLKKWTKSINHSLGCRCVWIKFASQTNCNFWSQSLTEYWQNVSHNAISLPVVIFIYYLYHVAPLTCCCLKRLLFTLFLTVSSHQNIASACTVPTWIVVVLDGLNNTQDMGKRQRSGMDTDIWQNGQRWWMHWRKSQRTGARIYELQSQK